MARSPLSVTRAQAPDRRPARRSMLRPRLRRASYRRNPLVGIMKVLLPSLAVAMLLLVVAWPQLASNDDSFRLQIAAVGAAGAGKPELLNPRVVGVDGRARPFQVTANQGLRVLNDSGREFYELQQPKADLTTESGSWVAVTAERGDLYRDDRMLFLKGHVSLFHDNGSEFVTEAATVNLDDRTAAGDMPIAGQGPAGLIEAEGFRLFERGDRILFTGKARVTIFAGSGS